MHFGQFGPFTFRQYHYIFVMYRGGMSSGKIHDIAIFIMRMQNLCATLNEHKVSQSSAKVRKDWYSHLLCVPLRILRVPYAFRILFGCG